MLLPGPARELLLSGNLSERNTAGVIHWAVGAESEHRPEKPGLHSHKSVDFGKTHNMPIGHPMHQHRCAPAALGQWQTLIEHGNLAAHADPEVRALAAHYGNPDEILRKDFVHPIPGITIAGKYYEDYGKDPGRVVGAWGAGNRRRTQAFRAFQIAPRLREQHGYAEITLELRAKVFG